MPRYILKHCSQSRAGKDASLSFLGKRAIENRKQPGVHLTMSLLEASGRNQKEKSGRVWVIG